MSGKEKVQSLDNYLWGMEDVGLGWVQGQVCRAKTIGTSLWQNGLDDNIEYNFTNSGKTIHIHYKSTTRKIWKIHEKRANDKNDNIARLYSNKKNDALTPSEIKSLLKQDGNYPNHLKFFELIIGTYESNNLENNNLLLAGEVEQVEGELN